MGAPLFQPPASDVIGVSAEGTRFCVVQSAASRICGNSLRDAAAVVASPGAASLRSLAVPPSSPGRSRRRVCSSQGSNAAIVSGSSWMPGRDSIASARSGGSASLRARNETSASDRVGPRSSTDRERFSDSLANAPAVMFRFVTRSARSSSRLPSFWKTTPARSIIRARSRGSSPRRASATIAVFFPAGPPYVNASFSDSAAVSPWTITSWVRSSAAVGS